MHRINATPGGWNLQSEGVSFLEQTPAPLVLLTAADTDIQTLAATIPKLPTKFPAFRVANLLNLQHQVSIDNYAEQVLQQAQVIILRLLGGRSYWAYGLEVVQEIAQNNDINFIVMPGDDALDPALMSHSTLPLGVVNKIWRYFNEGGTENIANALQYIADHCLSTSFNPPPPQVVPRIGLYSWLGKLAGGKLPITAKVGILFYRAHYLAGNTKVIDALCEALAKRNLEPVPVFVSSLRELDVQEELSEIFQPKDSQSISVLLNTTSFSLARLETEAPQLELWQKLDVPVLQVILSGGTVEQWQAQFQGLSPRDIAMNVALPEVDGRIISRAVSFKAVQTRHPQLETDVMVYEPVRDRIEFVAELAANWVRLRSKPPQQRRIALILANYPTRDGRIANGVGLDTPASCVEILRALQLAGYEVEKIPATGDELIRLLTGGVTNDPEGRELRPVLQSVSAQEYQEYFASLPQEVQQGICDRWREGGQEGQGGVNYFPTPHTPHTPPSPLSFPDPQSPIPGIQLGNIFVGIQPARGYDLDPSLNYHAPDLEPTHAYLAFYYWVRECFAADAVVHVGKHGNLEWLPGKSVALSSSCYPEVALGALPHLYPFIVNDPGEGSQAKRRTQAVIVDHLTPPLTRAELYGGLQQLENLIDEYYEAESLDPGRLSAVCSRIQELILKENLHLDLKLVNSQEQLPIGKIDGYLCELKEAQIRDGLHIFGQCPRGRQLRDLIVAIARHPNRYHHGLTRAIAEDLGLDFDPLTADFATQLSPHSQQILQEKFQLPCRIVGDAVEVLETYAATLVENLICSPTPPPSTPSLTWIHSRLLPALQKTHQEITHLLRGLDGRYVKSAPAGAPTRGRPEVLPTGNNFYTFDIRALPTEIAWDIGRKAAETLIECYTQEHGEYPKTLGLSLWGTATMRTGGDDIAEALALLGVQPVWDGAARRVVDFEILPLSVLGRPRVDVTLRISGFFRDAFPNLISLFDQAVAAVAILDEPPSLNPLAAQVRQETDFWMKQGLSSQEAQVRSRYRVFGSKPGAYGAGLQGLIESQNWTDDQDLARAYINWSCYAYTSCPSQEGLGELGGVSAPEAFEQRLSQMQIVLHNQDNREHDILDSDDYYQFQGGLTAAVRSIQGTNPQTYFGDNSMTAKPRVRTLKEEIARVYRSRVVNPKWIAGVMRHGYKGAFEMAATVDYLFAYDATAKCVEDHMYEGIAQAYLFDPVVSEFIQSRNPYALRDIAERLLEAQKRGLWQDANLQTLENLRNLVHQAEAVIEQKSTYLEK
ncbi:cobaltochelatase subunit CobN [Fischerella major NIES-592]|uniref:Cobaltochelatase subunit CobN n=4 Tax=Fischerella TaxID=1190 RepID=A0A1U7GX47_9CYAN|nr:MULTISPECIES: cobaltochelatase subunit CobN [Fischerella]OKH12847.1 cobaltochelatase subunit CobN [Fischerella major NIES-592]PMB37681.1 cobaltochelatase subunit CobN [Fischerella thermalis CCMEE 5330]BAU05288.1 cobaltochelatase [Fischerella sp. NIES-3754]BCX07548.1 MAG: cobaltochelatase subunit CobN [Fischerella sp.]